MKGLNALEGRKILKDLAKARRRRGGQRAVDGATKEEGDRDASKLSKKKEE